MDTDYPERLTAIMDRNNFTPAQLAAYLGVSYGAVRHWLVGTRTPDRAARRLIEVMETVAAMAPDIHTMLIPSADEMPQSKPRVRRAPPRRAAPFVAPGPEDLRS